MRNLKVLICVLLTLNLFSANGQVIDRSKAPEPAKAPPINLGEPQRFQLENGLKVFLVEDHSLPSVAMNLTIDKDPHMETGHVGLSSMMGDMMSAGTSTRTKTQIDEAIDFVGASLYTFSSGFYFSCLTKHVDKVVEIASDILLNPAFPEAELEKKRKRELSGLKSIKSSPDAMSSRVEKVLKYGNDHPYGEIQKKSDIENISIELCKEYYNTYFKPDNGYLVIVGDIDLKNAKSLCDKYFGNWISGEVPNFSYPIPEKPKGVNVSFVHKPGAVQSLIKIFYPVDFKIGDENTAQVNVMSNIFGGAFSSYLNANLREDKGYTYGSRGRVRSDRFVGSFSCSASVRNEVTDSSVQQMLFEMNRIKNELVEPSDMDRIKNNMIGDFALSLENQQTIARYALNTERYNLPKNYYRDMLDKVQNVSLEMIQQAANTFIDPNNCYVLVVGNKEIAEKLIQFDTDGNIDYYDYNAELVKMDQKPLPEGLTANQVINNYLMAQTSSTSMDEVRSKFKKIKSYKKVMTAELEAQGQSFKMNRTESFLSPSYFKAETNAMGMTIQSQVVNDKTGGEQNMQTGKKTFTDDERLAVIYDSRLDKDLVYEENGDDIQLAGIEKVMGEDCYVINRKISKGDETTEFYAISSGLLIQITKTEIVAEGAKPMVTTIQFTEYKDYGLMKLPSKNSMDAAGQNIEFTVESMNINEKLKSKEFIWEE
jgi:predicted Zn-dependent peptidase